MRLFDISLVKEEKFTLLPMRYYLINSETIRIDLKIWCSTQKLIWYYWTPIPPPTIIVQEYNIGFIFIYNQDPLASLDLIDFDATPDPVGNNSG